jgi:pyruvate carboxylase subunit B
MYKVTVDGTTHEVLVEEETGNIAAVKPVLPDVLAAPEPAIEVRAKLPGNVYEVFCAVGDRVKKGETLLILEAMKMESPVTAPTDGTIVSFEVEKGHTVQSGQLLVTLK